MPIALISWTFSTPRVGHSKSVLLSPMAAPITCQQADSLAPHPTPATPPNRHSFIGVFRCRVHSTASDNFRSAYGLSHSDGPPSVFVRRVYLASCFSTPTHLCHRRYFSQAAMVLCTKSGEESFEDLQERVGTSFHNPGAALAYLEQVSADQICPRFPSDPNNVLQTHRDVCRVPLSSMYFSSPCQPGISTLAARRGAVLDPCNMRTPTDPSYFRH